MKTTPMLKTPSGSAFDLQIIGFAGGLLLVGAATVAGLVMAEHWGTAPVVLIYILPVLAAAAYAGLWPALAAAVAGTLAFNYWFTEPYHTLMIHNPADIVTVVVLFLVAVVTSRLASLMREQARLAAAHASRNATIAGFARKLLSCSSQPQIASVATGQLAGLFACNAVLVSAAEPDKVTAAAPHAALLAPSDLAAAAVTMASGGPAGRGVQKLPLADWQFHPVTTETAVIAAIGLARDDGAPPVPDSQRALLDSLLDQLALALERARLEGEARDHASLEERDRLRSVLLASIGEEIKPRLNAIARAARDLRRGGTADKTAIAGITAEVTRLGRYVDGLVDLGLGGNPAPVELGALSIDLHGRRVLRDGAEVHLTPKEYALLAELAKHAGRVLTHGHLLRAVWGPAQSDQVDYLRVAIRSLRQKLESDPARPRLILNEPSVGYRLAAQPR